MENEKINLIESKIKSAFRIGIMILFWLAFCISVIIHEKFLEQREMEVTLDRIRTEHQVCPPYSYLQIEEGLENWSCQPI